MRRYVVTIEVEIVGDDDFSLNHAQDIVARQVWDLDMPDGAGEIVSTRDLNGEEVSV